MSETRPPRVRTKEPFRRQAVIRFEMPEDTLPLDHRARLLWRIVETLDMSAFTAGAKAVEGKQGRTRSTQLVISRPKESSRRAPPRPMRTPAT
jgi:hypothetical protein